MVFETVRLSELLSSSPSFVNDHDHPLDKEGVLRSKRFVQKWTLADPFETVLGRLDKNIRKGTEYFKYSTYD